MKGRSTADIGSPDSERGQSTAHAIIDPVDSGPALVTRTIIHRALGNFARQQLLANEISQVPALTAPRAAAQTGGPSPAATPVHRAPGLLLQRSPDDGGGTSSSAATADPSAAPAAPTGAVSDVGGAAPTATQPASGSALLVDDRADDLDPGQMRKSEFLAQLRSAARAAAEEALAGSILSAAGCPWIDHWIRHYQARDAHHVEGAIHRYVPEARAAATAADYIPLIAARVRRSVAEWRNTERVSGAPPGVAPEAPAGGGAGLLATGLSRVRRLFRKGPIGGAPSARPPRRGTSRARLRTLAGLRCAAAHGVCL